LLKKLGQTLADNTGITAYVHKVCVSVPSGDDMDMEVVGQSRSATSAEIHPDIETMWFYRQQKGLLRFPD
jgi:hypothetical protein